MVTREVNQYISELIMVFCEKLKIDTDDDAKKNVTLSRYDILDDTLKSNEIDVEKELLRKELSLLKERLKDKDAHIDSLQKAMLLIESKLPKTPEPIQEISSKAATDNATPSRQRRSRPSALTRQ